MKDDNDPNKLKEQLREINNKYFQRLGRISKEDKIAVVMSVAPDKYITMLTSEQRRLGGDVMVDELIKALSHMY